MYSKQGLSVHSGRCKHKRAAVVAEASQEKYGKGAKTQARGAHAKHVCYIY